MSAHPSNQRRAERKRATFTALVTDVITGLPMGQLGNLSSTGMLLISSKAPRSEAIYQVSMALAESGRLLTQSQPIELGIQEQWNEPAATPGQIWAGYRIVAISDADAARLESWLTQA
ncbi:PilZ domain-containing protein [Rhodanobacter sp. L36]|uniref:PilZ domain-containing protein n=1 Tax=Rhodanobacter sp. L36 TaxID=1747221 RepID=UPI00131C6789|nr:PilZ domain-containing protein [Rhodanobacter sp. L36]